MLLRNKWLYNVCPRAANLPHWILARSRIRDDIQILDATSVHHLLLYWSCDTNRSRDKHKQHEMNGLLCKWHVDMLPAILWMSRCVARSHHQVAVICKVHLSLLDTVQPLPAHIFSLWSVTSLSNCLAKYWPAWTLALCCRVLVFIRFRCIEATARYTVSI